MHVSLILDLTWLEIYNNENLFNQKQLDNTCTVFMIVYNYLMEI